MLSLLSWHHLKCWGASSPLGCPFLRTECPLFYSEVSKSSWLGRRDGCFPRRASRTTEYAEAGHCFPAPRCYKASSALGRFISLVLFSHHLSGYSISFLDKGKISVGRSCQLFLIAGSHSLIQCSTISQGPCYLSEHGAMAQPSYSPGEYWKPAPGY